MAVYSKARRAGRRQKRARLSAWRITLAMVLILTWVLPVILLIGSYPWTHTFVPSAALETVGRASAWIYGALYGAALPVVTLVRTRMGLPDTSNARGVRRWLLFALAPVFFGCTAYFFITTVVGYGLHVASPPESTTLVLPGKALRHTLRRCAQGVELQDIRVWNPRLVCHVPQRMLDELRDGGWITVRARASRYGMQVTGIESAERARPAGMPLAD